MKMAYQVSIQHSTTFMVDHTYYELCDLEKLKHHSAQVAEMLSAKVVEIEKIEIPNSVALAVLPPNF